jgi:hypothetical protein
MSPYNESTACGDASLDFLLFADIIPVNASGGSVRITRTCDADHAEGGGKKRQSLKQNGGASRARTDGLVVANDALSQLSYSPTERTNYWTANLFYQRLVLRHYDARELALSHCRP